MKKALSLLLVFCMLLSIFCPIAVSAADTQSKATKYPINKTASNQLDENDQVDVTLTVPGTVEGYIDVVFILGGGMTANLKTIKSAIEVFRPVMENGKATIRMGLISLEKGKEIILDLNSNEAVLDPDTYIDFVTEKFDSINDLPYGTTNLHSQLLEAQKMLAKETKAKAENKYVFVLATGRTYWFDDANGEQATIVNKVNSTYYWGDYLWKSQRGRHTGLYMIPDRYNNSYEAFFADVEKWVVADGDKYVYTPHFDVNDYSAYVTWEQNNNKDLRALGLTGSRYGNGIVNPKPTAENFITGTPAAIGSENHPLNALNYERAQYECVQVWKQMIASGYNCYSICSENPNYQNGSEYIKLGAGYTGTSTSQLGHSFMNYLATLAGQEFAPTVWDYERDSDGNFVSAYPVLQENFFDSVKDDMLYTCSIDSTVVDYIGYDDDEKEGYDFDFAFSDNGEWKEYATPSLVVGGKTYTTEKLETVTEGYDLSFTFTAPGANEPTFWLDYYRGNGTTEEHFVWTFGENVSLENLAHLTYKLKLVKKQTVPKINGMPYIAYTNQVATLYPVDSNGVEGKPQRFPIPYVEYIPGRDYEEHRFLKDKFSTPLYDRSFADVTLSVSGLTECNVDIVFILGGGMTENEATVRAAVEFFKPLMKEESETTSIKMGLIALERGQEVILDINKDPEALLKPATYEKVIKDSFDYISTLSMGSTNLESPLKAAKKMLDADKDVADENKYVFVISTGRTYVFDLEDPTTGAETQASVVNKLTIGGKSYILWNHRAWQQTRINHTSLYALPAQYDTYDEYFADIEKWVAADGDKYVYSIPAALTDESTTAYYDWYINNSTDFRYGSGRYSPAIKVEKEDGSWDYISTSVQDGIPYGYNKNAPVQHALNYERAQYESYMAYKALVDAGYTCFALCSEQVSYQNNSPYLKDQNWTATDKQIGHSFMDYLSQYSSQEDALVLFDYVYDANGNPIKYSNGRYSQVLKENFFEPIAAAITSNLSTGSFVVDYMGYEEGEYNFDFVVSDDKLPVVEVAGVEFNTAKLETANTGATASYVFTNDDVSFTLDYFAGNKKDTEYFIWTFGENVSSTLVSSITYTVELVESYGEYGDYYTAYTNIGAFLYPVDSNGNPKYTVGDNGTVYDESGIIVFGESFPRPAVDVIVLTENGKYGAIIKGSVILLNGDMYPGQFNFVLMNGTEVIATATNNNDGEFQFFVEFDKTGVYNYTVMQLKGDDESIKYDYEIGFDVRIDVLESQTIVTSEKIKFRNKASKPIKISRPITVSKKSSDGSESTWFALTNQRKEIIEIIECTDGTAKFSSLEFSSPGTYRYYVYEISDIEKGISETDDYIMIEFNVTRNKSNNLHAVMTIYGAERIEF